MRELCKNIYCLKDRRTIIDSSFKLMKISVINTFWPCVLFFVEKEVKVIVNFVCTSR
jgi:hypothetical protein